MTQRTRRRGLAWGALALAVAAVLALALTPGEGPEEGPTPALRVSHEDPARSSRTTLALQGPTPEAEVPGVEGLRTRVPPGGRARTLRVVVLDAQPDPEPVVGAVVSIGTAVGVRGAPSVLMDVERGERGTTDAAGEVSFDLPRVPRGRRPYLQVEARGYAGLTRQLNASTSDAVITLALQPAERLSGVVETLSGLPVAGVRVSARLLGYPRRRSPRLPAAMPGRLAVVVTDAQGWFEFSSLAHGLYRVDVDDENWTLSVKGWESDDDFAESVTLFRSGTEDDIRLVVQRLAFYKVRFVDDATGLGIPTATEALAVGVEPERGFRHLELDELFERPGRIDLGLQDDDPATWVGCVAVEFPRTPDTVTVAFAVPGYAYREFHARLRTASEVLRGAPDTLRLKSLGEDHGTVDVKVILPHGILLGEGTPILQAHLVNGIYLDIAGASIGESRWRFEHVPTTATEVALLSYWDTRVPVKVKAGETCDVVFDYTALSGITVAVRGSDGEEMFGASVYVSGMDHDFESKVPLDVAGLQVTARGEIRRAPFALVPGRYKVMAHLLGHRAARATVTVEPGHLEHVVLTLERSR